MLDFAAIDFETANEKRTSICSIGIVIVRNGKVVDKIYHLVKPTPNYYTYFCQKVHGMSDSDTCNASIFPEVWAQIMTLINGLPLVAHNATFDSNCLKMAFDHYAMEYPNYEFYCTCKASRKVFGKELPNHQLQTVSAYCGFNLTNHHHALADAEACAQIAIRIL